MADNLKTQLDIAAAEAIKVLVEIAKSNSSTSADRISAAQVLLAYQGMAHR